MLDDDEICRSMKSDRGAKEKHARLRKYVGITQRNTSQMD